MYAQLCALICLFVVGCYSQATHICPRPSQPCRLSVEIRNWNNEVITSAGTDTCTCNGGSTCSTNWSDNTRVIRRKLISTNNKIKLKMMLCQPIQPQRICNNGEIALVLTGSLIIPNNVQSYNCKCRGNRPLHLHTHMTNAQHLTEDRYICVYHKPFCSSANNYNQTCLLENNAESTISYPCRCRRPRSCIQIPWTNRGMCQISTRNTRNTG